MVSYKIAHLSDVHFFHFCKSPLQFLSKRFLGNFNYLLNRSRIHNAHLAYEVVSFLKELGVHHLIITGDYTTTASKKELASFKDYLSFLQREGINLYTIPGNHDIYTNTRKNRSRFYHTLKESLPLEKAFYETLFKERVASAHLFDAYFLVMIDCSFAMPLYKSTGRFSNEVEMALKALLAKLPKEAFIILACHYPYDLYKFPKAHLERGSHLETIIKNDPRIRLYLHGHRHILELSPKDGHTVIDSGSISLKEASSFNLLICKKENLEIKLYQKNKETWSPADGREISVG
ncbi:MAG: metallophosphoesterase [Verrucomicrobia bacterium]|nr:metallophosphoesterase [Verrucomicrobiota bacterium]